MEKEATMTINEFLYQFAPGYRELGQDEIEAINNFALLWSLFEAQVLNTNASVSAITSKITEWAHNGRLQNLNIEYFTEYFRSRYVENGDFNYRFEHLHLRHNDNIKLVKSALLAQTEDTESLLSAWLIIVLRFRNNFFHGIKWAYEMKDQKSNFEIAGNLLKKCLAIQALH